jgi:glutamate-1-semialdehyde 2,1-aminomutase
MVQEGWRSAAQKSGLSIDIGGIPPLSHFSFQHPDAQSMKAYFVQRMIDEGILASTSFYSMYAHSLEHVQTYLEHVVICFEETQELCAKGTLIDELRGLPAKSGFSRLT